MRLAWEPRIGNWGARRKKLDWADLDLRFPTHSPEKRRMDGAWSQLACLTLVHLHAGHGRVVHVVVAVVIVIGGPDLFGVGFVGVYVDHPSEDVGMKLAAGGF